MKQLVWALVLATSLLPLAAQTAADKRNNQTADVQTNPANQAEPAGEGAGPALLPAAMSFGCSIWDLGYSAAGSVTGGMYLRASLDLYVNQTVTLSIAFDTNILTTPFQDQLLSAGLMVHPLVIRNVSLLAFGLSWLADFPYLSGSQFLGLTLVPMAGYANLGPTGHLYMAFLPTSLHVDLTSGQTLWSFGFLSWKYFF
jgi:hypothetical protein